VSDFTTRDSVFTKEPDERRVILGGIIVTPLRDGVVASIAVKKLTPYTLVISRDATLVNRCRR